MHNKTTTFEIIEQVVLNGDELTKFAATSASEYDPDFLYIKVRAVSAGEYWGPNKNADYFEEKELKEAYNTFLDAHVFKNHENKQVENAIGSVIAATYNDKMHYVELFIKIDKSLAPTIVRGFEKGITTDVSMGCKVKYTKCSICNNAAKTRAEFCQHVKTQRNEILPDGRRSFEYNYGSRFHDISIVLNGADRTAKLLERVALEVGTMEKAASATRTFYNVLTDELETYVSDGISTEKVASDFSFRHKLTKRADFKKEIIDKIYALVLLNRLNRTFSKVKPQDFEKAASELIGKAVKAVENARNPFSSIVTRAALTIPTAMYTNYLMNERAEGNELNAPQRFMAANPGLAEGAMLLLSKPTFELGRKGTLGVLNKFQDVAKATKSAMGVNKAASISPFDADHFDKLASEYTNLFTKEANELLDLNIATQETIDIFKDASIDSTLAVDGLSKDQIRMVKVALCAYASGREDIVDEIKNQCRINDSDISKFVKLAIGVVDNELEKMASTAGMVLRNVFEDSFFLPHHPGVVAASLPAMLVDGLLMTKLVQSATDSHKGTSEGLGFKDRPGNMMFNQALPTEIKRSKEED